MAQHPSRHPLARAAIRRAMGKTHDPSEQVGELNIVPFLDIIVNLMLFLLATVAATMTLAQVEVTLPSSCSAGCPGRPSLDLRVSITERGVALASADGGYAPGCVASATGELTAPRRGGAHDLDAVRACLERLHARRPDESAAIVTADPDIPYEELIAVMDALRGSPEAPLFPTVRLSAGLR